LTIAGPNVPTVSEAPSVESALTQTIRFLARLGRERFFGKVTVNFQDGKIMLLHKEESIKPADLAR
jgi:hypothetical protein